MPSEPIVRVVPLQPHCFAFGGFELQMLNAMSAARERGANIEPLNPWNREADFDVLHMWGLDLQHCATVKWARAAGKGTILTALVEYPDWKARIRHWGSTLLGARRFLLPMLRQLDRITVVNSDQKNFLVGIVGIADSKITVIPNIVDDVYFESGDGSSIATFPSPMKVDRYVVSVGNICHRKNQLALATACEALGVPLLLVGNVLTGEESYGQAVERVLSSIPESRWIRQIKEGAQELVAAYQHATVFALPSHMEQQPIAALEAAACGKPLLLGDRPYGKQELYQNAAVANPDSPQSIAVALKAVLDDPHNYRTPRCVLSSCRRNAVGDAYLAAYRAIVTEGTAATASPIVGVDPAPPSPRHRRGRHTL